MAINLGILCGGRSGEHEVSLQSGQGIYAAVERERFQPMLVAIDKEGVWHLGGVDELLRERDDPARIHLDPSAPPVLPVMEGGRCQLLHKETREVLWEVDVFFPIIHGTDGEDGALQGLLRMLDVPFVGAGVLGSAIGMDKDVMKRLLAHAGLPVARWVTVRSLEEGMRLYPQLSQKWGLPLFVKPVALGSSVGVSRVDNPESFRAALEVAFSFDQRAVVEEAMQGREVECSVLGNRQGGSERPQASRPGEIVPAHDFYSYEAKYLDPEGALLVAPAELDGATEERVRELAVQAFEVLECDGLARVDFFLQEDGRLIVNEINTLPGFTKISMYPRLWEVSGLPYPQLITRLVELGLERHARSRALKRNYDFA
jgi:D-alanine-D-alanine ligase